jgi:hypothetical protein
VTQDRRFTASALPDFLIVGAMKAGTTTLYRWLGQQDDIVGIEDRHGS